MTDFSKDWFYALPIIKPEEREDDPERRPGLRGPFEIAHRVKHGQLPVGWNLKHDESRRGLLWQALSGILDEHPEFASAYMALALDTGLKDEEFALEVGKLNEDWERYLERKGTLSDHKHSAMSSLYHRVSCPQCSMLAAFAIQNKVLHDFFVNELLPLKPRDREQLLKERGLHPFLDVMIPDKTPQPEPKG